MNWLPRRVFQWILCVAAVVLAGCATKPPAAKNYIVFPPPPDEPRIQFLKSFGSESDLKGQNAFASFVLGSSQQAHRPIIKPYGIAATKGKAYIADTQVQHICIADLIKRRFQTLKPAGQATLAMPINIAVDTDGAMYITDTKREQVLMFDKKRDYIGEMGARGEMKPCGVKVTTDRLYITDLKNHCVRVYQKAGRKLLFTVPRDPKDENAILHSPTNIDVDQQGRMYVSDTGGFAVQIYDADGKHLRRVGDLGLQPGRFALPKGIGVDHEGRFYVVDAATTVVQVFDNEGKLLMYFGEPKTSGEGSLYLPAGLTIDYENVGLFQQYVAPGQKIEYLIWVTNQAGPKKVGVYGFLAKK
jgi:DNA-binding beta-propeller fold protein YncE